MKAGLLQGTKLSQNVCWQFSNSAGADNSVGATDERASGGECGRVETQYHAHDRPGTTNQAQMTKTDDRTS